MVIHSLGTRAPEIVYPFRLSIGKLGAKLDFCKIKAERRKSQQKQTFSGHDTLETSIREKIEMVWSLFASHKVMGGPRARFNFKLNWNALSGVGKVVPKFVGRNLWRN